MACPFFCPADELMRHTGPYPPPLGDLYRGSCRIDGSSPGAEIQSELCNLGYAGARCARFPAGNPDAVRFSLRSAGETTLTLVYAIERDHSPYSFGELRYAIGTRSVENCSNAALARQAEAYAASYLRRKSR
jgi:hypothetical protein